MENHKQIEKIRVFIRNLSHTGINVRVYEKCSQFSNFFEKAHIKVELEMYNQIILKEETALELGGVNKKSLSLIYPINEPHLIEDGKITLIGPEIDYIHDDSIDFGLFILIGVHTTQQTDFDILRHFNFISNGIEGFMIRSIPRRFWCRISKNIIKNFSFEFFGNAIIYLYTQKFKELINSLEVIFINSNPKILDKFMDLTLTIRNYLNGKWKEKIENWKKRIDCEYDWECNSCPYFDTCEEVKEVLEERNKIG